MSDDSPTLDTVFSYVDSRSAEFVRLLKEAVAIKSVSAWPKNRNELIKMVKWVEVKLKEVGVICELKNVGTESLPDGATIPLPPVLLGTLGNDDSKKTVLIYGHLDVQPALKSDGWDTEPFELVEKNGKLYGRGTTDDKGPVLGWINAIKSYQAVKKEIPVNLKFIFEGMEESGSLGLEELIMDMTETFLKDVDYIVISDNYWLSTTKPCLTYGLRGICYFFIEIQCANQDLHSGSFGGNLYEAMPDLIYMLNSLINKDGEILIDGIMQDVKSMSDAEKKTYKDIDFDVAEYKNNVGCNRLRHGQNKTLLLQHRWRYPSLSIHGIQGAFYEEGAKTVIPSKVIGKFSIRIVPNQTPEKVEKTVKEFLEKKWQKRGSPNTIKIYMQHGGKPWITSPYNKNYVAGARAIEKVFQVKPDFTREGGSIPVTLSFEKATGKSILLLPMGAADDGAHSQNEKINKKNFIDGIKVFCAYFEEISKV